MTKKRQSTESLIENGFLPEMIDLFKVVAGVHDEVFTDERARLLKHNPSGLPEVFFKEARVWTMLAFQMQLDAKRGGELPNLLFEPSPKAAFEEQYTLLAYLRYEPIQGK